MKNIDGLRADAHTRGRGGGCAVAMDAGARALPSRPPVPLRMRCGRAVSMCFYIYFINVLLLFGKRSQGVYLQGVGKSDITNVLRKEGAFQPIAASCQNYLTNKTN